MLEWLFSYCEREENTTKPIYRVHFSKTVWVRVIPNDSDNTNYLFDFSLNIL